VFAGNELDHRNWIVDFGPGGFGAIKKHLEYMFDHTTLVAEDDPHKDALMALDTAGVLDIRVVPAVGCEQTAYMVWQFANDHITKVTEGRCWVESVECFEHSSNSAVYSNPNAFELVMKATQTPPVIWKSVG
jgi:6-pyruvoyltetrahydropterin/6-carboxytetrahydropterin synthase